MNIKNIAYVLLCLFLSVPLYGASKKEGKKSNAKPAVQNTAPANSPITKKLDPTPTIETKKGPASFEESTMVRAALGKLKDNKYVIGALTAGTVVGVLVSQTFGKKLLSSDKSSSEVESLKKELAANEQRIAARAKKINNIIRSINLKTLRPQNCNACLKTIIFAAITCDLDEAEINKITEWEKENGSIRTKAFYETIRDNRKVFENVITEKIKLAFEQCDLTICQDELNVDTYNYDLLDINQQALLVYNIAKKQFLLIHGVTAEFPTYESFENALNHVAVGYILTDNQVLNKMDANSKNTFDSLAYAPMVFSFRASSPREQKEAFDFAKTIDDIVDHVYEKVK